MNVVNSKIVAELARSAGFNPYNFEGGNMQLFQKYTEALLHMCCETMHSELHRVRLSVDNIDRVIQEVKNRFGVKEEV